MTSNFDFLKEEFAQIADSAMRAERYAFFDPRVACFYARRSAELLISWLYRYDDDLVCPGKITLKPSLEQQSFKENVDRSIRDKFDLLRRLGNRAAHAPSPIDQWYGLTVTEELFHCCRWLCVTYRERDKYAAIPPFNEDIVRRIKWRMVDQDDDNGQLGLQKLDRDWRHRNKHIEELLKRQIEQARSLRESVDRLKEMLDQSVAPEELLESLGEAWKIPMSPLKAKIPDGETVHSSIDDIGFLDRHEILSQWPREPEDDKEALELIRSKIFAIKKRNMQVAPDYDYKEGATRKTIEVIMREGGWDLED